MPIDQIWFAKTPVEVGCEDVSTTQWCGVGVNFPKDDLNKRILPGSLTVKAPENKPGPKRKVPSLKLTWPMKIPIFPDKYHQNGGFSMAMLVYRSVIFQPSFFRGCNLTNLGGVT